MVFQSPQSFSSPSHEQKNKNRQIGPHFLLTNCHCVQSSSSLQQQNASTRANTHTTVHGGGGLEHFSSHYNTISLSSSDFLLPGKNSESIMGVVLLSSLLLLFLRKSTQSMNTLLFTAAVLMPFLCPAGDDGA